MRLLVKLMPYLELERNFHLEYSYKFYLFDHKLEQPFINCWIGPNKKDGLNQKLKKLKENQLPLLHHKIIGNYWNTMIYFRGYKTTNYFKSTIICS